jgi:hypothetical protein
MLNSLDIEQPNELEQSAQLQQSPQTSKFMQVTSTPAFPFTSRRGTFSIATDFRLQVEKYKYAIATAENFHLSDSGKIALAQLQKCWDSLEYDAFYGEKHPSCRRLRRYTEFDYAPMAGTLQPRQHQPYIQSKEMNAYAGGKDRHFGDLTAETYDNLLFQDLVDYNFSLFPLEEMWLDQPWICQVHIMRIVVGAGQTTAITPEGIHSDGYPFAGLHLLDRVDVVGGETTIYQPDETPLSKITFTQPLDSLWLEDRHLKHSVTDIACSHEKGHKKGTEAGYRDLLAISFSLPESIYSKKI